MKLSDIWKQGSGAPSSSVIPVGGLAIDSYAGKAYSKKSNGEIFEIGSNALITYLSDEIDKIWASPSIQNDQYLIAVTKALYAAYLGRSPTTDETLYWVQQVNRGELSTVTLEEAFYNACVQNGETLWKEYINPDSTTADKWTMIINNSDATLIATIRSWYITILRNYAPSDASVAYWATQVQSGNVSINDLDEAIFNAATVNNQYCYLVPDTLIDSWEVGEGGYVVPKDGIDDNIIDAPQDGGDVTTVDGINLVIADSTYNIPSHVTYLNTNKALVIKIINIYYKYFHRSPEVEGAYYWAYEYITKGWSDATLEEAIYKAGLLYATPMFAVYDNSQTNVFQQAYSTALKNLQDAQTSGDINYVNSASAAAAAAEITFVTATNADYAVVTAASNKSTVDQIVSLYGTVLGRPADAIYADAAGIAYWTNEVNSGKVTLSQMAQALETAAEEYKWYQGGAEWA